MRLPFDSRLLLSGAVVWSLLVLAAPFLDIPIIYAAGAAVCHQRPERSFHLPAGQVAVCARCLGLYLGGVAGFAAVAWRSRPVSELTATLARRIALAAATPTLVTLAGEWVFGWPIGNATRFLAALPLGGAVAAIIGVAIASEGRRAKASEVD
ncbi:MAG TPA: DUF2085 domain-containing protein [Vicinamibacterales bacterium]|nr:DUF2085 domain-containing protein [Vicinamibacterales bacterium]